jgi:hypothetical protein
MRVWSRKRKVFRQETKRDFFKIVTIGSALALAAGLIGIPTMKSYLARAVAKEADRVSSVIDPLVQFQFDYSRGTGLLAAKNAKAAVPFLMRCFNGHEYDYSVLVPLLNALDMSDDWLEGKLVMDKLLQHPEKLSTLEDPLAWNNLAVVETDIGVTYPQYLELARESLDRAAGLVQEGNKETRRYILQNSWILGILEQNHSQAQAAVKELLTINDDSIDIWDMVRRYKVFEVHFRSDPKGLSRRGEMWRRLENARGRSHRNRSHKPSPDKEPS